MRQLVTVKGSEFVRFHAFINCQGLSLTANRGSIENTGNEIIEDLASEIREIFARILSSDDWTNMEWLAEEAGSFQTTEKEKRNFQWRMEKVKKAKVADYQGLKLVEPLLNFSGMSRYFRSKFYQAA